MEENLFIEILDIAIDALQICNNIHERTGAINVPLDDVANEMNNITKKDIQDGFFVLCELSIIGDDGDYDHMNYDRDGNNKLRALLEQIKVDELEKQEEGLTPPIYVKIPKRN